MKLIEGEYDGKEFSLKAPRWMKIAMVISLVPTVIAVAVVLLLVLFR